jgi:hypothetical protein
MEKAENKRERFSWLTSKAFLTSFGALFILVFLVLLVLINVATQMEDIEAKLQYMPPQIEGTAISAQDAIVGQAVYVPIYSHIYAKGGKPFLLEATLSIRNSDPNKKITVRSVRYYNTEGTLIKNYFEKPLLLKPLETTEFLVEQKKIEGGSGANFIVEWDADTKVNDPVIEAIMVGIAPQASISFVRPGIPIQID